MARNGDVMRADRLKQVMQQIDPRFDERNAGYNRFSKFVTRSRNARTDSRDQAGERPARRCSARRGSAHHRRSRSSRRGPACAANQRRLQPPAAVLQPEPAEDGTPESRGDAVVAGVVAESPVMKAQSSTRAGCDEHCSTIRRHWRADARRSIPPAVARAWRVAGASGAARCSAHGWPRCTERKIRCSTRGVSTSCCVRRTTRKLPTCGWSAKDNSRFRRTRRISRMQMQRRPQLVAETPADGSPPTARPPAALRFRGGSRTGSRPSELQMVGVIDFSSEPPPAAGETEPAPPAAEPPVAEAPAASSVEVAGPPAGETPDAPRPAKRAPRERKAPVAAEPADYASSSRCQGSTQGEISSREENIDTPDFETARKLSPHAIEMARGSTGKDARLRPGRRACFGPHRRDRSVPGNSRRRVARVPSTPASIVCGHLRVGRHLVRLSVVRHPLVPEPDHANRRRWRRGAHSRARPRRGNRGDPRAPWKRAGSATRPMDRGRWVRRSPSAASRMACGRPREVRCGCCRGGASPARC